MHCALEAGTEERVLGQRQFKLNGSVDGWVRTGCSWLSAYVVKGNSVFRWHQTLHLEVNESLLHWKDTH